EVAGAVGDQQLEALVLRDNRTGSTESVSAVELGLSRGEIPVVRFDIPEIDAGPFIRQAFRRISVQLVIQDLRDQTLMVSEPTSARADEARGSKPV
ncbi:MAG TPA: hypothetical protein VHX16_11780, partial [Chloroflexota bacterium]|nr:hypothetical protein [Chloroflexota bacterium]